VPSVTQEVLCKTGIIPDPKPVFLAGYREQLSVAERICHASARSETLFRVFVVGYPGNGRWIFSRKLMSQLRAARPDFQFASIGNLSDISSNGAAAFGQVREALLERETPSLLVVGNLDDILMGRDPDVVQWLMTLLHDAHRRLIIVFLADEQPELMSTLGDAIDVPIYLPMPGEREAAQIFEHFQVKSPISLRVAELVFRFGKEKGVRYTNKMLIHAVADVVRSHPDYDSASAEALAELIASKCPGVDVPTIDAYEEGLALFRTRAETILKRWGRDVGSASTTE